MKKYSMTEAAKIIGVHRQTLINWVRKEWVKPQRDYKNYPVFTEKHIAEIKKWYERLRD